jgi:hypothetical protein
VNVSEVARIHHGKRLSAERLASDVPELEGGDMDRVNVASWSIDMGVNDVVAVLRQSLCLLREAPNPIAARPQVAFVDANLAYGEIMLELVRDDGDLMMHGHGSNDIDTVAFRSAESLAKSIHQHSDA